MLEARAMGATALVVCLLACCSCRRPSGHGVPSLAYISALTDNWRLCVINVDGTGRWEFPSDHPLADSSLPVWSPDGRCLAVVMGRMAGSAPPTADAICLVEPYHDTYTRIYIETDTERTIDDVAWAPDGDRLGFGSAPSAIYLHPPPGGQRGYEVWVVGSDGASPTRISAVGMGAGSPVWSPDGKWIAYGEWRQGKDPYEGLSRTREIVVAETGTWDYAKTIRGFPHLRLRAWSPAPAGYQVALVAEESHRATFVYGIFVADIAAGAIRRLAKDHELGYGPQWSPDGAKLAFTADRDGRAQLAVIGSDGEGEALLTESASNDMSPSWSPDGSQIAFLSDRAGAKQVFVLDVLSGEVRQVTDEPGDGVALRPPQWRPRAS